MVRLNKKFYTNYIEHISQLTFIENMFTEATEIMKKNAGKKIIELSKNLKYGDFRISFVLKDISSLREYIRRREEVPAPNNYLMLFKTGGNIPINDPVKILPSINELARSQGMKSTSPRITEWGFPEVSIYDEGQRIAVLWPGSYCTNEPDLALRIGKNIYGMQMNF
jgi:hypothetical protein